MVSSDFTFAEASGQNGASANDTTHCDNVLVSRGGRAASTHHEAPITAQWTAGAASVELSQKPEQHTAQAYGSYHYQHDFWRGISSPEPHVEAVSRRITNVNTHHEAPRTADWSAGAASFELTHAAQPRGVYPYEHDFWKEISSPEPRVVAQARRENGRIL